MSTEWEQQLNSPIHIHTDLPNKIEFSIFKSFLPSNILNPTYYVEFLEVFVFSYLEYFSLYQKKKSLRSGLHYYTAA